MKKIFLALLLIPMLALAQKPAWVELQSRNIHYPTSTYKVGYKSDNLMRGESVGDAKSRMIRGAREELMAGIQVSLQNVTVDKLRSVQYNDEFGDIDEALSMEFHSVTITKVDMQDVPGIVTESWYDQENAEVHGFAYVRISDLKNHFREKINMSLIRAESIIDNVSTLVEYGNKIKAREKAKTAMPLFAEVEYAQRLLLALDNSTNVRQSLQMEKAYRLKSEVLRLVADLQHSTAICLKCKAVTVGNRRYPTLANAIKGKLSEIGCNFVEEPSQADWIIDIDASVTKILNSSFVFAYVNGSVKVTKTATGQVIYEESIDAVENGHTADGIKGGGNSEASAASEAYKDVTRIVGDKLLKLIK